MRRSGARSVTGTRGIFQEFELYGFAAFRRTMLKDFPITDFKVHLSAGWLEESDVFVKVK